MVNGFVDSERSIKARLTWAQNGHPPVEHVPIVKASERKGTRMLISEPVALVVKVKKERVSCWPD
jgi:hypothetical protein